MAKKNLGGGSYNLRLGNDAWGREAIADVKDYTNTTITDGYFSGEHTIFANRNPTVDDTFVTLNGKTINFESRKWRWVNTVTEDVFFFVAYGGGNVTVLNGGGPSATDWINPVSGVAANWSVQADEQHAGYPPGGTYSVGAVSGFTGVAQTLQASATGYGAIETDLFTIESGKSYTLSFKATGDVAPSNPYVYVRDSSNTVLVGRSFTVTDGVVDDIVLDLGIINETSIKLTYSTNVFAAVGSGITIDEITLTKAVDIQWERLNDVSHLTIDGAQDGSILVAEDGTISTVSTTSGFIYVDASRTDEYTPNGTVFFPYKSLKECINDGNNDCTVVLNEGTYDAGESLAIPDSMNLIGTAYDNCVIAANVTFTNYTGDGQGVRYLRFSGNVTLVAGSWVMFERCYFVGTGTPISLGGRRSSLRDCNFEDTLGTITIASDHAHFYNTAIKKDVTVTALRATFSDCDIDGQLVHDTGAGTLILHNSAMNYVGGASLVSNVSGNTTTPILLSGVMHLGALQFNDAITIIHGTLPMSPLATISGNYVTVNTLTTGNTVEYEPTDDYHPATRKFVLDNAGGGDADVFISTLDKYFSHYPIDSKLVYSINGVDSFAITNAGIITPTVTGTDPALVSAALITEGWTIIASPWDASTDYSDGDKVFNKGLLYTSSGENLAGDFETQNWALDNTTVPGYEYYKPISGYSIGSQVKFYYNIFENQTAGAIVPSVTTSDPEDMIAEGWTIVKGAQIAEDKIRTLTPDGQWKISIEDKAIVDSAQTPVGSFLNYLPTIVTNRDPLETDITVKVGASEEDVTIGYGWRWVNTTTDTTWERRTAGDGWVKWLRQDVSEVITAVSYDIYIDGTLGDDDTGDGSSSTPFKTFLRAIEATPRILSNVSLTYYVAAGTYVFGDDEKAALGDKTYSATGIYLYGTYNTVISAPTLTETIVNSMNYAVTATGTTVVENELRGMYVEDSGKYYPIGHNTAGTDTFELSFMRASRNGARNIVENATIMDISATSDDSILEFNFPGVKEVIFSGFKLDRGSADEIKFSKLQTYTEFNFGCTFYADRVLLGDYNDQIITSIGFVGCVFDCQSTANALDAREAQGAYGITRCVLLNLNNPSAYAGSIALPKGSTLKVRECCIVGSGFTNAMEVYKGSTASLSKTNIFIDHDAIFTSKYGFGTYAYDDSVDPDHWIRLQNCKYLVDTPTEGLVVTFSTVTTDANYVKPVKNGGQLINPHAGTRIVLPGTYPDYSSDGSITVANGAVDYLLQVGSYDQNSIIYVDFEFVRGTLIEYGTIILNDAATTDITFTSYGDDVGVVVTKSIVGDAINLVFNDSLANGTATTMKHRIRRKMK